MEPIHYDNQSYLRSSVRWAKIVAIIQFLLLFGFCIILIRSIRSTNGFQSDDIIIFFLIAITIWMTINLFNYATNMKKALDSKNLYGTDYYTMGLKDLKNYFIRLSIILGFIFIKFVYGAYLILSRPKPSVAPWINDLF